jgi:phage-related protein
MQWGYVILAIILVGIAIAVYEVYIFFSNLAKAAAGIINDIIQAATMLYKDIVTALGTVINFFEQLPAFVDDLLGGLQSDLMGGLHDAETALSGLNSQLQSWGGKTAQELAGMKAQIADTVNTTMSTVQHGIQAAQGAIGGMQHVMISAMSSLSTDVKNGWSAVQSAGNTIVNDAATAGNDITSALGRL